MIGAVGRAASANAAKLVPRPEEEGFLFGEESSRWKKEEGMERKLNWTLDVSSHPPLLPQISIPHQKRQACSLYPIYQKKNFFCQTEQCVSPGPGRA